MKLTFALSALVLATSVVSGFAQDGGPRLRPIVTVDGDTVRLGDVIEGAGKHADLPVFGAPQPGQSGQISASRVATAARDHGLSNVDTRGLSSVVVRREGRRVGAEELTRALQAELVARNQLPKDIEIELNAGQFEAVVESSASGAIEIRSLQYAASGRIEATWVVAGSRAMELNPAKVVGSVSDIMKVAVLNRAVLRGDVVQAGDISFERRRRSDISDALSDPQRIVGYAAKRALPRGLMLRDQDLQRAELVERNSTVNMTFEQPGIQLSMRGRAMQAGTLGDTIQVQNINSKKIVEAVVKGPGLVTVTGVVIQNRTTASATPNQSQRSE
jgi:flagellar basal body P-ring formation protein FlgA